MKIYISGKITGLKIEDVKDRFSGAKALLEEIGFDVVNPLEKSISEDATWEQHMVKDIELLFGCDAIYMMDNWIDSRGAGIEYDIANRMGKDIWFESNVVRDSKDIMRIQNAIHEVTGLKFHEYITKSRKRDGFFARMIFVHHCRSLKMTLTKIAKFVHRDHSSMLHLLRKYQDEVRFNPHFRDMARRVDNLLNESKNEA